MHLFWAVLWSVQPLLTLSSAPDYCTIHNSDNSNNVSPLLESLECYNDYESCFYCKWKKHSTTLQLWLTAKSERQLCVPDSPPVEDGAVQCKAEAKAWAIGMKYTAFFLKNETKKICSSVPQKPVHLSQQLRARPPVDLTSYDADDGGRMINWSSPYPSSSSLSKNLTYQLSYKADRQDNWTTVDVTNTIIKLEKQWLHPGHRYKAKVRTRASVGQWSEWSPVVTWQTQNDSGQPPSLHCVLDGDTEVMCSWEVSKELSHYISYQLACRHNHTAKSERCCVNQTVSSDLDGAVLRFSCSLTVADPAHLLLELVPAHNARILDAYLLIKPKPPERLKVKEHDRNWIVEWIGPSNQNLQFLYEVCYYRSQDQETSTCDTVSAQDLTIPGLHLVPSQEYQVKVRSLVKPGEGSKYEGFPSEWTYSEKWTTLPATWSITSFLYFLLSVFVAIVFLLFYYTFPTCQRRVIVWVDSVPSPGKSKILSDIKSVNSQTLMKSEDTSICKVLHFDTLSTCSSDVSLWPINDTDKKCLDPDEGFWNCDNLTTTVNKVNCSDTSSMSFSGPYIFCQTSQSTLKSVGAKGEEVKEEKTSLDGSPSPGNFALYGHGYVCLPSRTVSRSTQELVSHSDDKKSTDSSGQDQQCPDTTLWSGKLNVETDLRETTSRDEPPAYTSAPFSPWPQGGHIQASGYCFIPQPK